MVNDKVTMPMIATSEYTKTSRIIYKGPCIVMAVHVAGDGANGDCQVYDGLNNKGTLKAHIEVLSGTSYNWRPGVGTDFDHGIYIKVSANTTKVTLTYISESRKAFI